MPYNKDTKISKYTSIAILEGGKIIVANKTVFNEIISDYAIARPGYPNELFFDIVEYSKLKPDAKILEIGAGPGQATDYFVKKGCSVTSLEIGNEQVQYLLEKYLDYHNFKAICSSFEEYDSLDETYELVFSATAFHWIEPVIGYPKAYKLLKRNGTLAVFWHLSSIVKHQTELNNELCKIFHKYAPELDTFLSIDEGEALHELRISQIQTNNLFDKPKTKIYTWNDEYTTERYAKLLNSYSDMHEIDDDKCKAVLNSVAEYIDSKGGKIVVPQEVRLYMAMK
jgi:SAM-dependent methyltransferase